MTVSISKTGDSGGISVSGLADVQDLIRQLPETAKDNLKKAINSTALAVTRDVKNKATLGRPYLFARTGSLMRSIKPEAATGAEIRNIKGAVYTTSKYARIQELGGIVEAKDKYLKVPGGPYLNIPLDANKTPAGVVRYSARDVFDMGGIIKKSKSGNWVVGLDEYSRGQNKGKTRSKIEKKLFYRFIPYFVLKKQVYIPPRLRMIESLNHNIPYFRALLQGILDGISPTAL